MTYNYISQLEEELSLAKARVKAGLYRTKSQSSKISALEKEVDKMELLLLALVKSLEKQGSLDPKILDETLKEIDVSDGVKDEKVTKKRYKNTATGLKKKAKFRGKKNLIKRKKSVEPNL